MPQPGPDPAVTDLELLLAVRNIYGPAAGTSEVAESVGISRQAVEKHLHRLAGDGLLNTRKIGQVRVWWLADAGEQYIYDHN